MRQSVRSDIKNPAILKILHITVQKEKGSSEIESSIENWSIVSSQLSINSYSAIICKIRVIRACPVQASRGSILNTGIEHPCPIYPPNG